MRLPRDLSEEDLAREHRITIPRRAQLRAGAVEAILADVGANFGPSREALVERLFAR